MRGTTLIAILSLAILAGSTLSAEAGRAGAAGVNSFSIADDGGGGGPRGNDRGTPNEHGFDDRDEGDGRRPCIGTSVYDCPPPPPKKKRKVAVRKPANDDDCTCRPIPIKVNNQTQIVLDCYETRMFNGVERTYVCRRPEILPRIR